MDVTFDLAFLILFSGYRTAKGQSFIAKDLDRAQMEAQAFVDRLAEIKKAQAEAAKKGQ